MIKIEITKEELKDFLDANGILQKRRWSLLVLFFFRIVPDDKYISKGLIIEVLKEWGFYCRGDASRVTNTMGILARDKAWLENVYFNYPMSPISEEERMRFCKKNVLPPVRIIGGGYTQSVFRLSDEGRKRILLLLECI